MNRFKMTQWGEEGQTSGGVTVSLSSAWRYVRRSTVMWLVLTPHVSSAPEQAEGGNKGSVKEAGNDLRACTMSAEIPLDADGSHPEQASESRVTASNMSHSLSERRAGWESKRQKTGKEEPLSDRSNCKCNHQKGAYLCRTDDINPFRKLLTDFQWRNE